MKHFYEDKCTSEHLHPASGLKIKDTEVTEVSKSGPYIKRVYCHFSKGRY